MPCSSYLIRLAEPSETALLPAVERRAGSLFENWRNETGLTPETVEELTSMEDFDDAQRRDHLWVAVSPGGEPVGFALVMDFGQVVPTENLVPPLCTLGIIEDLASAC